MRTGVKLAAGGFLLSVFSFVAGAAAYGWFAAQSMDDWNRLVQERFAIEQEARATRAEREKIRARIEEGLLRGFATGQSQALRVIEVSTKKAAPDDDAKSDETGALTTGSQ